MHLKLNQLNPENAKLPRSIGWKITKDKNGKSIPYVEFAEGIQVHCNFVNNTLQQESGFLNTFFPSTPLERWFKYHHLSLVS